MQDNQKKISPINLFLGELDFRIDRICTGCPKLLPLLNFRKDWKIFSKKEISILHKSYRKKVTGSAFFYKTACPKKQLALKNFLFLIIFFDILKTVLKVDLTFESWVSSFRNTKFMDKIIKFFS